MPKRRADQLDMFGAPQVESPKTKEFQPDPDTLALAASLDPLLKFGTSSWTFPGWSGLCYPPGTTDAELQREGLALYTRWPLFRTVGIDRSYYRPIPREELVAYSKQVPDDFRALEKVWDCITSAVVPQKVRASGPAEPNPHFLDPVTFRDAVWTPHEGVFDRHIAAFVLELPPIPAGHVPKPKEFADKLERFFAAAPPAARFAVELRNEALLTDDYLAVLRCRNVAHVWNLWSRMPRPLEQFRRTGFTADFGVIRLLQPPGTTYSERKEEFAPFDRLQAADDGLRDEVAAIAEHAIAAKTPLWTIVNNKAEGSAPLTIDALARRLARR